MVKLLAWMLNGPMIRAVAKTKMIMNLRLRFLKSKISYFYHNYSLIINNKISNQGVLLIEIGIQGL